MRNEGFSLIEILIATAILLVIVVMVSLVFQQQSAAFQSGSDRVSGQAALRNAVGMIVRDLSLSVDSEDYKGKGLPNNSFSKSSISFLALTGQVAAGTNSTLEYISYSQSGGIVKRKAVQYGLKDNGSWAKVGDMEASINSKNSAIHSLSFSTSGDSNTFPDTVTITAEHQGKSSAASVIGWSAGMDGEWNTDDDVYVGGKPQ